MPTRALKEKQMSDFKADGARYIESVERKLEALLAIEAESEVLSAMQYSVLGAGKRVRSMLCLASHELCCGSQGDDALLAACSLEMVHAYSLIHDDLPCMDDDDMRRGKPSCHKAFGEAMALLAGDGLLTLAFETLCKIKDCPTAIDCVRTLAQSAGICGMIGGQELDLKYEHTPCSQSQLDGIHLKKTGALIRAGVLLGAFTAKASESQRAALASYADNLGLAFQICDDVLDCTADEAVLGKHTGSDEKSGKNTYVTLFGIARSRELAFETTQRSINMLEDEFGDGKFLSELARNLLQRTM